MNFAVSDQNNSVFMQKNYANNKKKICEDSLYFYNWLQKVLTLTNFSLKSNFCAKKILHLKNQLQEKVMFQQFVSNFTNFRINNIHAINSSIFRHLKNISNEKYIFGS